LRRGLDESVDGATPSRTLALLSSSAAHSALSLLFRSFSTFHVSIKVCSSRCLHPPQRSAFATTHPASP
jgi:hypothetical protein